MDSKILYLRSLTLEGLLKSYKAGEFLNLCLKDIEDIESIESIVLNMQHKDNNKSIVYAVSESDYFPIDRYKLEEGIRCIYCLRKIVDKNFIGIPISYEYVENGKKLFHCVDVFCTFNCCLSELIPRLRDYRYSSLYSKSEVLLNLIFSHYHPNKQLSPTTYDRRYLKILNGTLGYKEFHKDSLGITNSNDNIMISQRPLERR